jgi:glutathione S-transferase
VTKPTLYGADYSVYVAIARLALEEKGVEYEHVPVDVFAADGVPPWYLEYHPFGRIPAFAHGDLRLYETSAICRYVDEAFDGPPLQPADAYRRARMSQIIGMLDAYAYRPMVWDVAVERMEKSTPDEDLIAAGLERSATALGALAALKAEGPWLLGDDLSLADLHAAPIIGYFTRVSEGRTLLARYPAIEAWMGRLAERESYRRGRPAGA